MSVKHLLWGALGGIGIAGAGIAAIVTLCLICLSFIPVVTPGGYSAVPAGAVELRLPLLALEDLPAAQGCSALRSFLSCLEETEGWSRARERYGGDPPTERVANALAALLRLQEQGPGEGR